MKKVCIVTISLGKGGAERFCALLSKMLVKLQYDVHILMINDDIDYEYAGTLFNFKKEYGNDLSYFNKIKKSKSYFNKHNFDIIIDNRSRNNFLREFVLYHYIFKAKRKFSIVHSYCLENYFPRSKFLAKVLYKNQTEFVSVSKGIQEAIASKYHFKKGIHIYNPADIEYIENRANENIEVSEAFILFFGRIENSIKNFDLLLNAYKISTLSNRNIKLYIVGEGSDVAILKSNIKSNQLDGYVKYFPFISNPFPLVKQAIFTTLTSYYEGFPMVLIESLVCGTPVVSVNCKSGPSEIIDHEHNGLLVENHNPGLLAKAFNRFVEDKSLYKRCKENTKESVNALSVDKITEKWAALIE